MTRGQKLGLLLDVVIVVALLVYAILEIAGFR